MRSSTIIHNAVVVIVFASFLVHSSCGSSSPCPDFGKGREYGCSTVILPPSLCSTCSIGAYDSSGEYLDCTRTSNMDTNAQCVSAIEDYVKLNPCDVKRRQAMEWYKGDDPYYRERGRQTLDYAVYALCENGCDCIPQETANPKVPAMDVHRGNCQAHMWYDICKILPNIKLIQSNGTANSISGSIDVTDLPEVCPTVKTWVTTADGRNFREVAHTYVHPDVENFLNHLFDAQQILSTDHWHQCYAMEGTQKRILQAPFETIRINAGQLGLDYVDGQGNVWMTDRYFGPSSSFVSEASGGDILGTSDDPLYLTQRSNNGPVDYTIPVPNGEYNVKLGFSETVFHAAGQRVFNVVVQGETVQSSFDIWKAGRKAWVPIELSKAVNVTHGTLYVHLEPIVQNPTIATVVVEKIQ